MAAILSRPQSVNGGHCDGTGHLKMAVLGMARDQSDNTLKLRNHVIV